MRSVAKERAGQLGHLGSPQSLQTQAHIRVPERINGRRSADIFLCAQGRHNKQRMRLCTPRDGCEYGSRGFVAPLDVVDKQGDRADLGQRYQPLRHRALDTQALLSRLRDGFGRLDLSQLVREIFEDAREHGRGGPRQTGDVLGTRCNRGFDQPSDHAIGIPPSRLRTRREGCHPGELRRQSELGEQPALPRSGGGFDKHGPPVPLPRLLRASFKEFHLAATADHRGTGEVAFADGEAGLLGELGHRLESIDDLGRVGRASQRIETQHSPHEVPELHGNVGVERFQRRRWPAPHRLEIVEASGLVRIAPGQHPVRERPQTVEIGPVVEWKAAQVLGRNASRGSGDVARQPHGGQQSEVEQFCVAVGCAPHVSRSNVAVDHPARMQERQRGRNVSENAAGTRPRLLPHVLEVGSLEELHRVERSRVVDAKVVGLDDARVDQVGERVELASEPQHAPPVVVAAHGLEGHDSTGGDVLDAVDSAHAPLAQGAQDPIPRPDQPLCG